MAVRDSNLLLLLLSFFVIGCSNNSSGGKTTPDKAKNTTNKVIEPIPHNRPTHRLPKDKSSLETLANTKTPEASFASTSGFLTTLDKRKLPISDYSADMSIDATIFGSNLSVSGNVFIKSDSIFWMNITYLGIEMARLKLTNDSIFFVNKYQNTFMIDDYHKMYKVLGFTISRDEMESVFLGRAIHTTPEATLVYPNDSVISIHNRTAYRANILRFMRHSLLPHHFEIQDFKQFRAMNIRFKEFTELNNNGYKIPSHFVLNFNNQTKLDIEVEDIELDESNFSYPFNSKFNGYQQIR